MLIYQSVQAEPYAIIDNNAWVYHDLFVKRFGMNPQNVDNELSGARGVAIRLVPLARQRCHQTGNNGGEICFPSWQWLMDLYIDIDQDIGIEGDSPRQFKPWRSSLFFLARRNPALRERWEEAFGLKGGRLYLEAGDGKKGQRREVPFEIFSYKRPIKEGLMIIQARINEEIILADPAEKRIIEFSDSAGKVIHRVILPESYWPRVAGIRAKYASITEKNWKGGVEKDPHIWVYTKEFARKYKMPGENISDEMEGAMAMAFRMDSWGTYTDLKFSAPERMNFPNMELWDIYLPADAKIYYADPTIDNFYKGFHSSNVFVHEITNRSDWTGTYPNLVAGVGLKNGGAHILRQWIYKRRFKIFNWIKTDKKTKWYGGPIWHQMYIQPQVLQTDFIFLEELDIRSDMGPDQYFVFFDMSVDCLRATCLYNSDHYKARIPTPFMKKTLEYRMNNLNERHYLFEKENK
jgi:hypothetical protein